MKTDDKDSVRLNKYLASRLDMGRRQADALIERGSVLVNGNAAELGGRVVPGRDVVVVNGKVLSGDDGSTEHVYLMLHKPVGYVCSRRRQGDSPTIYELLPTEYKHLKSVGRLDKDSSGLLLMTNDGDFAHQMTHPRFYKIKRYEVGLDKPLEPLHHQIINDFGVKLDDGPSKLTLERLKEGDSHEWIVTMHEGRNRQIRRTFASLGYEVKRLHRTNFGNYALNSLGVGKCEVIELVA